ncbi:MAG: hypothetical protein MZW92_14595 [Comamonadaceae bacterium]|nr:hypothetical protein [Comamonadaceae bacterium]
MLQFLGDVNAVPRPLGRCADDGRRRALRAPARAWTSLPNPARRHLPAMQLMQALTVGPQHAAGVPPRR